MQPNFSAKGLHLNSFIYLFFDQINQIVSKIFWCIETFIMKRFSTYIID